MSSVFITGGGGLIGQEIARKHLQEGDTVYIWDNRSNLYNDYSNLVGIDVSHLSLLESLSRIRPKIISNQASKVGVGESQYKIFQYSANNIGMLAELLQSLLIIPHTPKIIIHAGSMGPYGEGARYCSKCGVVSVKNRRRTILIKCPMCGILTDPTLTDENFPFNPQSIYATTKAWQEYVLKVFSDTYGVPCVSLRYFSVYGTKNNPNNPYTGVLSIIGNKIINSNAVVLNEDGWQTRDLIHVSDVAEAHWLASRSSLTGFSAINIGTSKPNFIGKIAEKMVKNLHFPGKIEYNGLVRSGDVRDSIADIERAYIVLEWRPKIDLEDSIAKYCQFLINNWDLFRREDTCAQADSELKSHNLLGVG